MLENMPFTKVYVITGYTDMRNGIAGLTALVRLRYGLDTLEEGTLFLFCGRSCSKLTRGENVTTDILCRICKVLNVGMDDIMELIDE